MAFKVDMAQGRYNPPGAAIVCGAFFRLHDTHVVGRPVARELADDIMKIVAKLRCRIILGFCDIPV